MSLDPIGIFSYGDGTDDGTYVFPVSTRTTDYTIKPVPDSSGRVNAYEQITIGVSWVVTVDSDAEDDEDTIDPVIDRIYQILRIRGGILRMETAGFGTLNINGDIDGDDAPRDVKWGPVTTSFTNQLLGGAQASRLNWTFTVCTVTCAQNGGDGITDDSQPMELVYRATYALDKSGYSTRTLAFRVVIAQTRNAPDDPVPIASADEWFDDIIPNQLPGFRRTYPERTISEDGCTLTATIVDTELPPNALPPGCVDAEVSHAVRNTGAKPGLAYWMGTISGWFEMARDQPPQNAWEAFFHIIQTRLDAAQQNFQPLNSGDDSQTGSDMDNVGFILPVGLELRENNIFGKPVSSFSFSYTFAQNLSNILNACGLWLPTDYTWDAWSQSLQQSALNPRGNAQIVDDAGSRYMLDLCVAGGNTTIKSLSNLPAGLQSQLSQVLGSPPDPANSWILYENAIVDESGQNVMLTAPLPGAQLSDDDGGDDSSTDDAPDGYDPSPFGANEPKGNVQVRAGGQYVVYLVGKAIRACYNIEPPTLASVQNVTATLANRGSDYGEGFATWALGDFGWPVMAANWRMRFILEKAPDNIAAPGTPLMAGGATLSANGSLTVDPPTSNADGIGGGPGGGNDLF